MRSPEPRDPRAVPDHVGVDVGAGVDTDRDGRADSLFTDDGDDLLLHTDLDGDGRADQVLRIGPDGTAVLDPPPTSSPPEDPPPADPEPPSLIEVLVRLLRLPH